MVLTLHTLKAKPLKEQMRVLEVLAEQNLDLFEGVRSLLEDRSENSTFHISLSADRRKVVQLALLAVVAADITTIPDRRAREPYRRNLESLCSHFGIDIADVTDMIRYTSQIEMLLESKTQSLKPSSRSPYSTDSGQV